MNKTASNARLKASLEELARFGCPVDSSVAVTEVENEKVEIEQVGGIIESHLFELEDGRVACMAYIAVTNQTARTIDVVDVELRATWDDSVFQWLTPTQVKFYTRAKRALQPHGLSVPGEQDWSLSTRGHQPLPYGAQEATRQTRWKGGSWGSEASCPLGYVTGSGWICVSRSLDPTTLSTRRPFSFGRTGCWLGRRS